jgi:hypothetical protein
MQKLTYTFILTAALVSSVPSLAAGPEGSGSLSRALAAISNHRWVVPVRGGMNGFTGDAMGNAGGNAMGNAGGNAMGNPGGNTMGNPGGNTMGNPGGNTMGNPGGNPMGVMNGDRSDANAMSTGNTATGNGAAAGDGQTGSRTSCVNSYTPDTPMLFRWARCAVGVRGSTR